MRIVLSKWLVSVLVGLLTAFSAQGATKTISLSEFSRVRVDLSAEVTVTRGEPATATVSGESRILDLVAFEYADGELIIRPSTSFSSQQPLKIALVAPHIDELALNGSGEIDMHDILEPRLTLAINGAGDITASGRASNLVAVIRGAGDLKLRRLETVKADVTVEGAGNIEVTALQQLTAVINGSGDIVYFGQPTALRREINGAGLIREQ